MTAGNVVSRHYDSLLVKVRLMVMSSTKEPLVSQEQIVSDQNCKLYYVNVVNENQWQITV